jgi:hypothetical protein
MRRTRRNALRPRGEEEVGMLVGIGLFAGFRADNGDDRMERERDERQGRQ